MLSVPGVFVIVICSLLIFNLKTYVGHLYEKNQTSL